MEGTPKEFGYIVDYEGLLGEHDQALTKYSSLEGYDEEDLAGAVRDVREVLEDLPRLHGEVWDVFKEVRTNKDGESREQHLADEERRVAFYSACGHSAGRSTPRRPTTFTAVKKLDTWRKDWAAFDKLRRSVRIRYGDAGDMRTIEPKMRALLDRHLVAEPAETIVELVEIADIGRSLSGINGPEGAPPDEVAGLAKELTDLVRSRLIVRFRENDVALGDLRNAMDDHLFELAPERGISLSPDQIDAVIRETLRVAEARFPR